MAAKNNTQDLGVVGLAKALGVSRQSVYDAEKSGRIEREVSGKFNVAKARAAWERQAPKIDNFARREAKKPVEPERPTKHPSHETQTDTQRYNKARADREEVDAAMAKFELQLKEGTLLDAQIVRGLYTNALIVLRNNILGICRELAPSLVGMVDENAIADKIYQRCEIALASVVDQVGERQNQSNKEAATH